MRKEQYIFYVTENKADYTIFKNKCLSVWELFYYLKKYIYNYSV